MTSPETKNIPHLVAPPPLVYLFGLLIGWGLDWVWPWVLLPDYLGVPLGLLSVVPGLTLMGWSIVEFKRANTPVIPYQETTALVKTGPYRFSRNPIYVGMTAVYLGISFWMNSPWPLAMIPGVLAVIRWGVIGPEETYLQTKFGDAYLRYKASTPRWLGW
jgi:protein-S-isoprenylcysteine O-methyltransferase Ste14